MVKYYLCRVRNATRLPGETREKASGNRRLTQKAQRRTCCRLSAFSIQLSRRGDLCSPWVCSRKPAHNEKVVGLLFTATVGLKFQSADVQGRQDILDTFIVPDTHTAAAGPDVRVISSRDGEFTAIACVDGKRQERLGVKSLANIVRHVFILAAVPPIRH